MNNRGARRRYSNREKWNVKRGGSVRRGRNSGFGKNIEISGVNFFAILAIIGMAILLGFMTTKFVVYPMILGEEASFETNFLSVLVGHGEDSNDTDSNYIDSGDGSENVSVSAVTDTLANDSDKTESLPAVTNPITNHSAEKDNSEGDDIENKLTGYCIQYGSFSTEGAASELVNELKASGLTAQVVQKDGTYKVIGQLFQTRDEAVSAKNDVVSYANQEYADVFVTSI